MTEPVAETPERSGHIFSEEEQASDVLMKSLSLRMPVFEKGTDPKVKLEAYEEFMVLTAYIEAELRSEKFRCIDLLNEANDEWNGMDTSSDFRGIQVSMAEKERERRAENLVLYQRRRWLTQRIEALDGEIDRMERQAKVCSRVHTFLTGT